MQFRFEHKTYVLDENIERIHEEMEENIHLPFIPFQRYHFLNTNSCVDEVFDIPVL